MLLISLRASLGKQKLLISSIRRARASLSTRARLSLSKNGNKGPKMSKTGPLICGSAREEPCKQVETESAYNIIWRLSFFTLLFKKRKERMSQVISFCVCFSNISAACLRTYQVHYVLSIK